MKKRLFALALALMMLGTLFVPAGAVNLYAGEEAAAAEIPLGTEAREEVPGASAPRAALTAVTLTPVTDEDGTEWYELATAEDLTAFRNLVHGMEGAAGKPDINARLTADIVYNENLLDENGAFNEAVTSPKRWTPWQYSSSNLCCYGIGSKSKPYAGTFDGQGHTISGLYQKATFNGESVYLGLFSYTSPTAVIKNVTLADSYFCAATTGSNCTAYMGGICAFNAGTIENCTVHVLIDRGTSTTAMLGGICGQNSGDRIEYKWYDAVVRNCVATGAITSSRSGGVYAGGICAQSANTTVENCASLMDITVDSADLENVGGITATMGEGGAIRSCYNGGDVHGAAGVVSKWTENTNNSGELKGVVKVSNNYYLADTAAPDTQGMGDPVSRLDTGRLCWLLNGGYAQQGEPVWYQNIEGVEKDPYPVPDATHRTVYRQGEVYTNEPMNCTMPGIPAIAQDGYYEIRTRDDLFWLATAVNANEDTAKRFNARLMNDIVINQNMLKADGSLNPSDDFERWVPMGYTTVNGYNTEYHPYSGVFDGNGHTISGLLLRGHCLENIGLVAWGGDAEIKDLTIKDSCFVGFRSVAGFVSQSYPVKGERTRYVTLTNCHMDGGLVRGFLNVAGVAGNLADNAVSGDPPTLSYCSNSAAVTGCQGVAGVVAGVSCNDRSSAALVNCWNTGTVHGFTLQSGFTVLAGNVGGVCGAASTGAYATTTIQGCWNAGAVTSDYADGGYGSVTGTLAGSSRMVNCAGISTAPGPAETIVTPKGFASGQAAWVLNGGENQMETPVWYQNVDNGKTPDPYPVLDDTHGAVYKGVISWSNFPADAYYVPQDTDGAYLIGSAEALYWFARKVNEGGENLALNAKLVADIVVNEDVLNDDGTPNGTPELTWTPIADSYNGYTGTFDGQGHTISGLYHNDRTNNIRMGLFGYLEGGTVKNVTVADSFFATYSRVGAIAGHLDGGVIENCHNAGSTVYGITDSGNRGAGGIVGYVNGAGAAITCCTNSGLVRAFNVSGVTYVNPMGLGGIAGHVEQGAISYCVNSGVVRSSGNTVGGIAGKLCAGGATVSHCGNSGTVSGYNHVGGLCGAVEGGAALSASWSTGSGSASGDYDEGAVVGSANGGTVSADCYYPESVGNRSAKGTQKTQAEFDAGDVCTAAVHNAQNGVCTFCGKKDAAQITGTAGAWTVTADLASVGRPLVLIGADFADGNAMGALEARPLILTAAQTEAEGGFSFAAGRVFLLDPVTLAPICPALK